jgi:hypothetical protein
MPCVDLFKQKEGVKGHTPYIAGTLYDAEGVHTFIPFIQDSCGTVYAWKACN